MSWFRIERLHLHSHYDDFQQLQAQFERLSPLGVILVTRTHEEVLEFPPQGLLLLFLLLLLLPDLRAQQTRGTPTPKKVLGSIVGHRGEQSVLLWETETWGLVKAHM